MANAKQVRVLTPQGKTVGTRALDANYHYFGVSFLPSGREISISGQDQQYCLQPTLIWNLETNTTRQATDKETDSRWCLSPDQKVVLKIEFRGGKGERHPLGELFFLPALIQIVPAT